jgi:hypothetical protein
MKRPVRMLAERNRQIAAATLKVDYDEASRRIDICRRCPDGLARREAQSKLTLWRVSQSKGPYEKIKVPLKKS